MHVQLEDAIELSLNDSEVLINILLNSMAEIEDKIYEQDYKDDIYMFGLLANRDNLRSVVGSFILLCIPKLDSQVLEKLFNTFLNYLRQENKFHLPKWVYHQSIQQSIAYLDRKHMEILCEFYLQSLDNKDSGSDYFYGLMNVAASYFSKETLNKFLKCLIERINAHSHNRSQQKPA